VLMPADGHVAWHAVDNAGKPPEARSVRHTRPTMCMLSWTSRL
jgi:hypothetical protein